MHKEYIHQRLSGFKVRQTVREKTLRHLPCIYKLNLI